VGLDDDRVADALDEPLQRPHRVYEPAPRDGHAGRAQHVLHPVLVPEPARVLDVEAGHPRRLAGFGQRHLELLERSGQAVDGSHAVLQPAHRPGQLGAVSAVAHAKVPRDPRRERLRDLVGGILADHREHDAVELRERLDVAVRVLEKAGRDERDVVMGRVLAPG
jgi:hypothetical protein